MRKFWGSLVTLLVLLFGWPVAKDGFIGGVIFLGTLCILVFWWWAEIKFR